MATATEERPKTEIAIRVDANKLATIESVISQCGFSAVAHAGHFERAMKMAAGIRMLKQLITDDLLDELMQLQNTKLGFKTDRPQGYDRDTVRQCFLEATMYGGYPVGNEFNIIAGQSYLTKEYYTRKLNEFPGLQYTPQPGVPTMAGDKGALVPFIVTWRYYGTPGKLERLLRKVKREDGTEEVFDERIPVRVNSGMGTDAILGKATRKMFKAVFEVLSGIQTPDGDADDRVIDEPPRRLDELTDRLTKSNGDSAAPQTTSSDPGELLAFDGVTAESELNACRTITEVAGVVARLIAAHERDEETVAWIKDRGEARRNAIRDARTDTQK